MLSRVTFNIVRRSLCNNTRTLYALPSNLTCNSCIKKHSVQDHCNLYVAKRFKSGRKKKFEERKQGRDEESDEEENVVEEEEAPAGSKIATISVQAIRLDVFSKIGFGLSRNKIDEAFYSSKIRVNGQKVFKKSKEMVVGDEIDLILHRDLENPSFLVIHRINILSMVPGSNNIKVKLSKDKNLLIENYEDPWSEAS